MIELDIIGKWGLCIIQINTNMLCYFNCVVVYDMEIDACLIFAKYLSSHLQQ